MKWRVWQVYDRRFFWIAFREDEHAATAQEFNTWRAAYDYASMMARQELLNEITRQVRERR